MNSMRAVRPRRSAMLRPDSRISPGGGELQSQHHACQRRLAGAGLADDGKYLRLPFLDREAGVRHRLDVAPRTGTPPMANRLETLATSRDRAHAAAPFALRLAGVSGSTSALRPARRAVVGADRLQGRHLGPALVDGERAARVEAAAARRVGQVGRASAAAPATRSRTGSA